MVEGQKETWRIFATVHERGRILFNAIEDEQGLFNLNVLPRPNQLEQVLAPTGERSFASWNPYFALAVRFEFSKDGDLMLSMGDSDSILLERAR